jgi:hypothetical protein
MPRREREGEQRPASELDIWDVLKALRAHDDALGEELSVPIGRARAIDVSERMSALGELLLVDRELRGRNSLEPFIGNRLA